jgi:hypothetical protein
MAPNPINPLIKLALAPVRLAGKAGVGLLPGRRRPAPPPDDVTIARRVESTIFRAGAADKRKVEVNVVEGVVWLRGEARTPELIRELEQRAREVPEVRRVESLLQTPKTPDRSRTDRPARKTKTGRSPRPAQRRTARAGGAGEAAAKTAGTPAEGPDSARPG